jgi:hypothetical protein
MGFLDYLKNSIVTFVIGFIAVIMIVYSAAANLMGEMYPELSFLRGIVGLVVGFAGVLLILYARHRYNHDIKKIR